MSEPRSSSIPRLATGAVFVAAILGMSACAETVRPVLGGLRIGPPADGPFVTPRADRRRGPFRVSAGCLGAGRGGAKRSCVSTFHPRAPWTPWRSRPRREMPSSTPRPWRAPGGSATVRHVTATARWRCGRSFPCVTPCRRLPQRPTTRGRGERRGNADRPARRGEDGGGVPWGLIAGSEWACCSVASPPSTRFPSSPRET